MATAVADKAQAESPPIPPAPPKQQTASQTQTAPPIAAAPASPFTQPLTPTPAPAPVAPPFIIHSAKPKAGSPAPYLKGLIYGTYGSGKTYFGGSAIDVPEMRDVLFIDAEGGSLVINDRENLDKVEVRDYRTLDGIKEYLIRHCAARDSGDIDSLLKMERVLKQDPSITVPRQYRTVVIDSLSELYRLLMYDLLGIRPGETNLDLQIDQPEWKDYGQASQRVLLMIRTFREIPVNVIFIASSQEKENEVKQVRSIPNVSGKLAKDIQGFLDVVGFLRSVANDKGEVIRRLDLVGTQQFDAKHRFVHAKQNFLMNPTMLDLFNLAHNRSK